MRQREIGTGGAFGIFGLILAMVMVGRLAFGFDTIVLLMLVSMVTSSIFCFYYGIPWNDSFNKGVVPMFAKATGAFLLMLSVGPLIAVWIKGGSIPYIIWVGLKLINPQWFLIAATLVCSIASILTGTSYGSAATFGIAFMGIAHGLGISTAATAGAIIVGCYFGDKISPISDTTVLASTTAEVDIIDHIKSMMWTTVPAYLLSLLVYGFVGMQATGNVDISKISEITNVLEKQFMLTPWSLIPPLIVLFLSFKGCPTLPVLWVGTISAFPLCMIQGSSFVDVVKVMAAGPAVSTGVAAMDKLLNRGGVMFMSGAILTVFCAYIFAGQLEYSGAISKISNFLKEKFIKDSSGRFIFATSITGILSVLGTGNSYLGIIIPGTMYKDLSDEMGIPRKVLSRTLEDSGTVITPIVPWSAAGIYFATLLEVPTLESLPWAIMCYTGFLFAWAYGFMNIAIWRKK